MTSKSAKCAFFDCPGYCKTGLSGVSFVSDAVHIFTYWEKQLFASPQSAFFGEAHGCLQKCLDAMKHPECQASWAAFISEEKRKILHEAMSVYAHLDEDHKKRHASIQASVLAADGAVAKKKSRIRI